MPRYDVRVYHWILTLQQPARGLATPATATFAGVAELDTSKTRSQAYLEIFAKYAAVMQEETGLRVEPNTIFFALAPDSLET